MKKVIVAVVGGTVLLVGVALLILPGPGLTNIGVGIAILASEFLWARRALKNAKGAVAKARRRSGLGAWLRRWRRPK